MQTGIRSTSLRVFRRYGRPIAAVLLLSLALTGCDRADPLEAVRRQHAAGEFDASIEPLRELLAANPDDPEVNYLYGMALVYTQPHLAVWSLRKAMEDPDWQVPAGLQLAFLALNSLDYNEAVKATGRVLEREPDNIQALLMRGNAYAHSKKDPELALADAKRVLEIDPDRLEAYEPLILALLGLDRLEEANQALVESGRRLKELGGAESVFAWHCATTAISEEASGKLDRARETWAGCLEAHPIDVDVVTSAVAFFDGRGEKERSLQILRATLEAAPASPFFRGVLAQRLSASGDTAAAEALLREATLAKDTETAAAAWLSLSKFLQGLGQFGPSADAVERAVEQIEAAGPPSPQLMFEYADSLVLADRLDRALEVAKDFSVPAHGHLIRGRVAQKRREPARALREYDAALRLWPDNAFARYYAALAAQELGDFERAIEEFRNAIRVDPKATDARTLAAAQLLAAGIPGAAQTMLLTEIDDAPLDIEGLLLGMKVSGLLGSTSGVADFLARIEDSHPERVGQALAEAADGLAESVSPAMAVSMLTTAPGVDFNQPRYTAALRALVRYSHQLEKGAALRARLKKILATNPNSGAFQEIRALDLELSGAPPEAVPAAYARALELAPENALALAALGRLAAGKDPEAALGYFDRAAAADPSNPEPKLAAARILVASGKLAEAGQRLDALLLEHPCAGAAAAESARVDLAQGIASPHTVERARRASRFGEGADGLDLLSHVYTQRNETDLAARAAEGAKAMRAAEASEG